MASYVAAEAQTSSQDQAVEPPVAGVEPPVAGGEPSVVGGEPSAARAQQPAARGNPANWLTGTPITSENVALNIIVGFIGVAQKRGAFSLEEAARLHQCITMFRRGASS